MRGQEQETGPVLTQEQWADVATQCGAYIAGYIQTRGRLLQEGGAERTPATLAFSVECAAQSFIEDNLETAITAVYA